ncbi:MAG: DUF4136 domain-containing protein [Bacteroidetes bacterium]|uniref:DUF4136 domain-containing protein n=1 Tax=Candidatus Cryptobacteroides merdavium TaxID=2840769 RepID=A0A9D9EDX4_9BACT|nr:DUF4136 domain-containing protein [Candidatus Cryptobacteroides merdavium]
MKKILLFIVAAAALMACRKEPDMSETDGNYFVYTAYDTSSDFSKYSSYIVADSILIMDSGRYNYVKASESPMVADIIRTYRDQMNSLGYTEAGTKEDADLGIQISYIEETHYFTQIVSDPYWWWGYPGYWSPSWWGGWYGGWAPYSYPVSYSYSTHSYLTEMVDLTPLTGDAETDRDVHLSVVWNSYLDGSLVSGNVTSRLEEAIAQSFSQSKDVFSK